MVFTWYSYHMNINLEALMELISSQYPQFKNLSLKEMKPQGHDHISYRLGHIYVLRLPSDSSYSTQVIKEAEVLPLIAPKLSINIPRPLLLFKANDLFPYPFSIMRFVDGEVYQKDKIDAFDLVDKLATVLVELRHCPNFDKWLCGQHNFYRGAHISVYEDETREHLKLIENIEDKKVLEDLLNKAMKTEWKDKPVFVHGDIAANNLLIENRKLVGLIDFGSCGMGDPACDYVIAWNNFTFNERKHFRNLLNIDAGTWLRASVWALWKALLNLEDEKLKTQGLYTITEILEDIKKEALI